MSNEHKDWLMDQAQDFMLINEYIDRIEYTDSFKHGYLIIGLKNWVRQAYYVWWEEPDGWACYQL